jgi:hypothetical protein
MLLASVAIWVAMGANCGWTRTNVRRTFVDEVTGIEGVTYTRGFVPGLDFLAVTVAGSGILAGAAFLCFNPRTEKHP